MEQQTTECRDCALKHLALALSLSKERPFPKQTFVGELLNAVTHLSHFTGKGWDDEANNLMGSTSLPAHILSDRVRALWVAVEMEAPLGEVEETCPYTPDVSDRIAEAISYATEILSGHRKHSDPDHRPDYLGCIVHIERLLLESGLQATSAAFTRYRRALQSRRCSLTADDISYLRRLDERIRYTPKTETLEALMSGVTPDTSPVADFGGLPQSQSLHDAPAVIVTGTMSVDLALRLIKDNLTDHGPIYTDPSRVPWSMLGSHVIIWPSNTGLIRPASALSLPLVYSRHPFNMDGLAPMALPTEAAAKVTNWTTAMTEHYKAPSRAMHDAAGLVATVDRKVCCSLRRKLSRAVLVRWPDEAGAMHLAEWYDNRAGLSGKVPDL